MLPQILPNLTSRIQPHDALLDYRRDRVVKSRSTMLFACPQAGNKLSPAIGISWLLAHLQWSTTCSLDWRFNLTAQHHEWLNQDECRIFVRIQIKRMSKWNCSQFEICHCYRDLVLENQIEKQGRTREHKESTGQNTNKTNLSCIQTE